MDDHLREPDRDTTGRSGRHKLRVPAGAAAALLAGSLLAACGSGTPQPDATKAPQEIQHVYNVLFNFSSKTVDDKVAVVEDGSSLRKALTEGLASPLAALAKGAKVTKTALLSESSCKAATVKAPCARVTYDILGGSGTLNAGAKGYAVYLDGKWLVARPTVCGLLTTMYATLGKTGSPPGC